MSLLQKAVGNITSNPPTMMENFLKDLQGVIYLTCKTTGMNHYQEQRPYNNAKLHNFLHKLVMDGQMHSNKDRSNPFMKLFDTSHSKSTCRLQFHIYQVPILGRKP